MSIIIIKNFEIWATVLFQCKKHNRCNTYKKIIAFQIYLNKTFQALGMNCRRMPCTHLRVSAWGSQVWWWSLTCFPSCVCGVFHPQPTGRHCCQNRTHSATPSSLQCRPLAAGICLIASSLAKWCQSLDFHCPGNKCEIGIKGSTMQY